MGNALTPDEGPAPVTASDIWDLTRWAVVVAPGFEFETIEPGQTGYIRADTPNDLMNPVLQRFMRHRSYQELYG